MNEKDLTRKKLVKVVRDYHSDVCRDGSSCMVYEYKDESDKKTHLKAFAGYAYYSHERTENQNLPDENYHGSTFEIGIGVEVDIERVILDITWGNTAHYGIYLGGGAQLAVGKHFARLHADWYKSLEGSGTGNMMKWGLTAEFGL